MEEISMPNLVGTKTAENLKVAFAGESQANRRYLYFAEKADAEGLSDVAELFRAISKGETKHAFGHFDHLCEGGVGDPATGLQVRNTREMLESAIAGEKYEYTEMYPGFAATAREEGFPEIGEWMEVMAKAERVHAQRFQKMLDSLE
jgi:rubrerythrin